MPNREGAETMSLSFRSVVPCIAALSLGLAACGPAAPPAPAPTSPPAAKPTTPPAPAPTTAPAAAPTTAPAAKPAAAAAAPADAAAPEQQVFVKAFDSTADFTTLDFFESVYKRAQANAD